MPPLEPVQLSLPVSLRDEATFDNYVPSGNSSRQALSKINDVLKAPSSAPFEYIFLWGTPGSGLTHLLQAACRFALEKRTAALYLSLSGHRDARPDKILDGAERHDLVCLDDVDAVFGVKEWEEQLFHLYNTLKEQHAVLLASAHTAPQMMAIDLKDLSSRLMSGVTFRIENMSDDEKKQAFMARAEARGMECSADLAAFILTHISRDPSALFQLLNILDTHSLQAQRRLTIPFVKSVIERQRQSLD